MNKFVGAGTLPRNGMVIGSDKKVLRFTLATLVGHNKKTKKDLWAYVPCVIFKPTEKTIGLLTENTSEGIQGRTWKTEFSRIFDSEAYLLLTFRREHLGR